MNDGGPAFPTTVKEPNGLIGYPDVSVSKPGLSLRDYFAAHSGLTLQLHVFTGADGKIELLDPSSVTEDAQRRIVEWKATMSYLIADALLRAREKE